MTKLNVVCLQHQKPYFEVWRMQIRKLTHIWFNIKYNFKSKGKFEEDLLRTNTIKMAKQI